MSYVPKIRAGLIVRGIGDEVLAYDSTFDRVHNLNAEVARVFAAIDGTRDVAAIAQATGLTEGTVEVAIDNLAEQALLENKQSLSRRTLIGASAAGVGALAISSVAAPAAAAIVTCPDSDPQALESLCSVFLQFTQDAIDRGDLLGIDAGECGTGADLSFGNLTQCLGFKFFYKESSAPIGQGNALNELKFDYRWCRNDDNVPYIQLKASNGQNFPVGPIAPFTPDSCNCVSNCLLQVDLPNSNNFIFGYGVPPNAQSLTYELCYPVAAGVSPTNFSIWKAVITGADKMTLLAPLTLNSNGDTAIIMSDTNQCEEGCANIPTLLPDEQLVIAFTNIGNGPGDVYVNVTPSASPCA